jgi:hypothetical protein
VGIERQGIGEIEKLCHFIVSAEFQGKLACGDKSAPLVQRSGAELTGSAQGRDR